MTDTMKRKIESDSKIEEPNSLFSNDGKIRPFPFNTTREKNSNLNNAFPDNKFNKDNLDYINNLLKSKEHEKSTNTMKAKHKRIMSKLKNKMGITIRK